jgi:hypothetical protein
MLLNQAIAHQQELYAQVQAQIELLQEKQREIQANLQKLGSVESKMESAVHVLQEAVAEIIEHCPGEMQQYQELVNGLFGEKPIATLTEGKDAEEANVLDVAPDDNGDGDNSIDIDVVAEVVDEVKGIPERLTPYIPSIKEINSAKRSDLIKMLEEFNLDVTGSVKTLRNRLKNHLIVIERSSQDSDQAILGLEGNAEKTD